LFLLTYILKVEMMSVWISQYKMLKGIEKTPIEGPVASGRHYSMVIKELKIPK
jgi:hypothetical protein